MDSIPITYGDFYDVPRMIHFQLDGLWYFMRSYFDEYKDEHADYYEVYLLPFRSEDELRSNPRYWADLTDAIHLGRIPIGQVGLDETRRRSIDADAMKAWLSDRRKESGL